MDNHLQPSEQTFTAASTVHSHKGPNSTSIAPLDRPTFTFIDHDDDLTSKRIKDVKARKAIRSHVMRDVRRRERLAGMKRASKRENRNGQYSQSARSSQSESGAGSSESTLPLRTAASSSSSSSSPASLSSQELESAHDLVKSKPRQRRLTTWKKGQHMTPNSLPNPQSFPTSWFLDPFHTLPGTDELPSMVARLVFYWKSVFVPTTFPKEHKISQKAEIELMVKSSFSDPGSFFGLMSMCAAHRAVLAGRHSDLMNSSESIYRVLHDPDYYVMKAKCIREMNAKVRDPERALSNEAFDTIINLLSSALIVGFFDEARIHLTGLKRMVELRGGIENESISKSPMFAAILSTDVKAAAGLMTNPVFPLIWSSQPVPFAIQERIRPPPSSTLNRLGAAFSANPLLSLPLLEILQVLREIVFYSQTYRENPSLLLPEDHDFFRVFNLETEHQLLSYPYSGTGMASDCSSNSELGLHPMEAITRVASICFLNHFLIVSPPSTGLGRALTKHLKKAASNCTISLLSRLPTENYNLLAWALFIGAQGSAGQAERAWFVERLSHIARVCGWQDWEQVSEILTEYFYVSNTDDPIWKTIWSEAMAGFITSTVVEV